MKLTKLQINSDYLSLAFIATLAAPPLILDKLVPLTMNGVDFVDPLTSL